MAEPVTSATETVVRQGPWAAATILVFGAMSWLAKKVIERGWKQHDARILHLEELVRLANDRADTSEKAYRETARLNTAATDVLRERRRDQ
jgi:hypothetical protein